MLGLQTATPSLAGSAVNILFRFTFNLELFELSADTTYDLYLYDVRSDMVIRRRLFPPEYPFILILYGSDRTDRRLHRHCPGGGCSWLGACTNTCSSIKAIATLVELRNCCGVIPVSNRYSFLPIVIHISALYSLGPLGLIRITSLLSLQMSRVIKPIQIKEVD